MLAKCLTEKCSAQAAPMRRGLCTRCYRSAKKLVESGQTTWAELDGMGLAQSEDKFLVEFKKRKEGS